MAVGLYRDRDGWVMVEYDAHSAPIPKDRYEDNGYKPAFDDLPTKEQYEAKQNLKARSGPPT